MKAFLQVTPIILALTTTLISMPPNTKANEGSNQQSEQLGTRDEWINSALDEVQAKNNRLEEFLDENDVVRFELDWEGAPNTITFLNSKDKELKEFVFVVIGTFSPRTKTWKWGWDNPGYSDRIREISSYQKDISKSLGTMAFVQEGKFEATEEGAWLFGAMAVKFYGADALYLDRGTENIEGKELITYFALMDPDKK